MIIYLTALIIYVAINLVIFEIIIHPALSDAERQDWSTTPFRSAAVICTATLPAAILSMLGLLK